MGARVGKSLVEGVRMIASRSDVHVLGFPMVSPSDVWQWSLRKVRHQYWKLMYSVHRKYSDLSVLPDDLGSACNEKCLCAQGGATSSTRVFRDGSTFRSLVLEVNGNTGDFFNWFVELDLQTQWARRSVCTCALWPMPEEDYLARASLSSHLSEQYQIEVALFLDRKFELCIPGANWFQVVQKGLVAPWCFRRDVVKAFRDVHSWWIASDPERSFVIPEEGTFLALFRNGEAGMLPW